MKLMYKHILVLMMITVALPMQTEAQDRTQARSMVISRQGIVAAESPLAAQAAATLLSQGGNAVDAAIAANAVMGVVAPMMNGIGGDMFAIVYEAKSGKLYGINASGWSPAKLTLGEAQRRGMTNMPKTGIDSVTVPGVVDGWDKLLNRFGRKKFSTVLEPAIRYAEEGFPVGEIVSLYWADSEELLRNDKSASRTYLPQDHPLAVGEIFRNPDLAWSLKQIASKGRKAYYEGEIGRRIVDYSKRQGGTMELTDLARYSSEWVEPISTTYRGWTVYEMPPNGQGIAALEMLNLMEKFPLNEYGQNSAKALHVMIEAKKLAYADMYRYVADPRFSKVPVTQILSKDYAFDRSTLINADEANCFVDAADVLEPGKDTTYLCVVDAEGNMVSFIQSNYSSFGSGLVADGTGFALQNRGALFNLDPGSPNVLAGNKRPLHTIIPAFMKKDKVQIAFGIMGGWNQAQAHAQFVSNVVDHDLNIQAALEAPRFTKLTFDGCDLQVESRIPHEVREELTAKGHDIYIRGDFCQAMGGGQAVMRNMETGVNFGASDPRKDGAAVPEPLKK